MTARLLVVTTVHRPDDPRIRSKLIPTLEAEWDITYATREPGPTEIAGFAWVPLTGGRLHRWLRASRVLLRKQWDLVAIHDPELVVGGLVRAWLGRPTLFDLHEDLPVQIESRDWIPRFLRPGLALVSRWILKLAERSMAITLAEPGYQGLFNRLHPVLANYLPPKMPDPIPPADPPFLAYLGDVTEIRGAYLAIEAAAGAARSLVMVGRVAPPELAPSLARRAAELGVELELVGQLDHRTALERIASASAGLSPLHDVGNYRYSLPTKVPEYLALGLPVLAADLPGTREPTLGLAGMVFVPPGDARAWRRAGEAHARDTADRERLLAQIEEVRKRFAWPEEAVIAAYRQAVSRGAL